MPSRSLRIVSRSPRSTASIQPAGRLSSSQARTSARTPCSSALSTSSSSATATAHSSLQNLTGRSRIVGRVQPLPYGPMWSVLARHRDLRLLFIAQLVSYLGDWFATVALMGLVLDLTHSAAAAAAVFVAQTLPSFFA